MNFKILFYEEDIPCAISSKSGRWRSYFESNFADKSNIFDYRLFYGHILIQAICGSPRKTIDSDMQNDEARDSVLNGVKKALNREHRQIANTFPQKIYKNLFSR